MTATSIGVCPHQKQETSMTTPTPAPNDGYYEAYWPRTPRQAGIKQLAPRHKSLEGKTVAFLWDYIFRGDVIFGLLEVGLNARYPGMRFISHTEFGNIHAGTEKEILAALPQKLKDLKVDAVVCGMAC
jgi:hypothetical protein